MLARTGCQVGHFLLVLVTVKAWTRFPGKEGCYWSDQKHCSETRGSRSLWHIKFSSLSEHGMVTAPCDDPRGSPSCSSVNRLVCVWRLYASSWSFYTDSWQTPAHTDAAVKNQNCPLEEGTREKHHCTAGKGLTVG